MADGDSGTDVTKAWRGQRVRAVPGLGARGFESLFPFWLARALAVDCVPRARAWRGMLAAGKNVGRSRFKKSVNFFKKSSKFSGIGLV
jgi:hypothetical protein